MDIPLDDPLTLAAALATLAFGMWLTRRIDWLERANIPPAVSGGLLVAVALAVLHSTAGYRVTFSTELRSLLLLVFFAALGFSARFARLREGGWAVGAICVVIIITIVAQNTAGVAIAQAFGLDPRLGPFLGSIAYLGGHGTTAAWAQASQVEGVTGAFEVGIASATLGLIAGGLAGGPVATFLARRAAGAHPQAAGPPAQAAALPAPVLEAPLSTDRWILSFLVIAVALAGGELAGRGATAMHFALPAFLTALLAAVLITNVADAIGRPVDVARAGLIGTLALRIFLAMSLLSLQFETLGRFILPLSAALAAQTVLTCLIALLLVYRVAGRGVDGAVGAGGFIGFALGAMPVGIATMSRLTERIGPAPKALLVVTLAAALFQDTANALIVRAVFWFLGR